MADIDADDARPGQSSYEEALAHNWRSLPASAAIAYAKFTVAAQQGHPGALRELAEMMFAGAGAPAQPQRALATMWAAFRRGDLEAIDEISAMLDSYAESLPDGMDRIRAAGAASKADEAFELLRYLDSYIDNLRMEAQHVSRQR